MRLGGIVNRIPHPAAPDLPSSGGPQMVEASRDGRQVYFTNSLCGSWDDQFYPDGVGAWTARVDADPNGGLREGNTRARAERQGLHLEEPSCR